MISFSPLWCYLRLHRLSRIYLLRVISSPTLAKLGRNQNVDISTINKICAYLECQPGDIMIFIPDK